MLKTQINPANLQAHLESASNAAAKGQAQYHTPIEWGTVLAGALPRYRPAVVDLTCGTGQLLTAVSGPSTLHTLGCDIEDVMRDDVRRDTEPLTPHVSRITQHASRLSSFAHSDLTKFYPLLRAVKFKADLFALNPPWDLHWYREPLADLLDSDCAAVRLAFAAHDGRTATGTIDSTVATLCLALDLMSPCGEGFLIGNEATLQRLILGPDAPHRLLAAHVWAHLAIEGNICDAKAESRKRKAENDFPISALPISAFRTGVLYFARGHTAGCQFERNIPNDDAKAHTKLAVAELAERRLELRRGAVIKQVAYTKESPPLWAACAEELQNQKAEIGKQKWNLWLDAGGLIRTDLSVFDKNCGRIDKQAADRLFDLNGRNPMQLVVQRAQRRELEIAAGCDAATPSPWRVSPGLQAAVKSAVQAYHAVRAPIVPLSKIQRLGYLDELDTILCEKNLEMRKAESRNGPARISTFPVSNFCFTAGRSYAIRTLTIQTRRAGEKMNLEGGIDAVEWSGSELAIYLTDDAGVERLFMESRLRTADVRLAISPPPVEAGDAGRRPAAEDDDHVTGLDAIAFTLQQLAEHFAIPEVPDVATLFPVKYQHNLDLLTEIERLVNAV